MKPETQSWLTTNNIIPLIGIVITLVTILVNTSVSGEKQNSKIDLVAQKVDQVLQNQENMNTSYKEIMTRLGKADVTNERQTSEISSILLRIKNSL